MVPFLLQESAKNTVTLTSLLGVYIALGGTLAAALLAALSSWNAARTAKEAAVLAASTAEKVADLSRQTTKEVADLSRQTAKEVADLSAQVTKESSTLAARTAQELKEKDYQNDFYKRIIEKRLKAWEQAEDFISLIISVVSTTRDGKKVRMSRYFITVENFTEVFEKSRSYYLSQNLWLGGEYAKVFRQYRKKLVAIRKQCVVDRTKDELQGLQENVVSKLNHTLLAQVGTDKFDELNTISNNLIAELSRQIPDLHNIEEFFKNLPVHKQQSVSEAVVSQSNVQ